MFTIKEIWQKKSIVELLPLLLDAMLQIVESLHERGQCDQCKITWP
jgi:hypothetical protein